MLRPLILPDSVKFTVSAVQEPVWYDLGIVPAMAVQTTVQGYTPRFLVPSDEHMLIGFGDWTENLGQVPLSGYRLDSGEPETVFDVPSMGLWRVRTFEGKHYIPWTDPTESGPGGYTTNASGSWVNHVMPVETFPLCHVIDITIRNGNVILAGSSHDDVFIDQGHIAVHYSDGSWDIAALRSGFTGAFGGSNRFNQFFHLDNGRLGVRTSETSEPFSSEDGITWEPDPSVPLDTTYSYSPQVIEDLPPEYDQGLFVAQQLIVHGGYAWAAASTGHVWRAKV